MGVSAPDRFCFFVSPSGNQPKRNRGARDRGRECEGRGGERERELTLSRVLIASSCFAFCLQKKCAAVLEKSLNHDFIHFMTTQLPGTGSLVFIALSASSCSLSCPQSPLSFPPSFFTGSPHSTVLNHPPPADPQHRPLAHTPSSRLGPQLFFMRQNTVV